MKSQGKADDCQWILVQQHWSLGKKTVYLSREAIKIVCEDGMNILTRAPDWNVICFRNNEKLVWNCRRQDFSGNIFFLQPAMRVNEFDKLLLDSHCRYLGQNCHKYSHPARIFNYTLTSDIIPVNNQAADFFCRYYNIPNVRQMPLMRSELHIRDPRQLALTKQGKDSFLSIKAVHEGQITFLQTLSAKKTLLNPGDFAIPSGLRPVNDPKELALSNEQQTDLTDILNEIGFSSEAGRH